MKKLALILVFLSILLPVSNSLFSQSIGINKAKDIARNHLLAVGKNNLKSAGIRKTNFQFSNAKAAVENKDTLYYILNDTINKGFVIVSADKRVWPILGYSLQGTYNEEKKPEAFIAWMEARKKEIAYMIANNLKADDQTVSEWTQLETGNTSLQSNSVEPLIKTTWDQWPYYNDLCPAVNGVHAPTGCVATAMAQIMKYWNYPTTGKDSISYKIATYGTIAANFGATTYQWAQMPDKVTSPNNAVATLMFHCGAATKMIYTPTSSGAWNPSEAMTKYFDYSTNAETFSRDDYSASNWANLLISELDLGHPIFYMNSSGDENNSHAWVCDGYQNEDYFHFNWGWGGGADGYFHLNALNPFGFNFNANQAVVLKIIPNRLPDGYKGIFLSTNAITLEPKEGISPAIKVTIASSANWTANSDQTWLTISASNGIAGTSTLNLTSTENNSNSDRAAVVTVSATGYPKQTITVKQYHMVKVSAGNLHDLVAGDLATTTYLGISGTMDARDFKTIRDEVPFLKKLDISDATIVEYNGTGGTSGNIETLYPANVIPDYAFNVKETWQSKTLMRSILLPPSIIAIGDNAFFNCRVLNSITLPSMVTKIGNSAFFNCRFLVTAFIPPAVTSIGYQAFSYCDHLVLDPISSSVTSIGTGAFSNIKGLIVVDPNNPNYSSQDGVLYNKNKTILLQCPTSLAGSFIIPQTVHTIESGAFLGNYKLISITLPPSLISIGQIAFSGCSNIKSFTIPSSVKTIEAYAFENWLRAESVTAESLNPVVLNNSPGVFWNMDKTKVTLKVPFGSKAAYQTADQWKDFKNIVEMPGVFISASSMQFGASKGSGSVDISSSVNWTASSNQPWLTLSSAAGVPGNSTLVLNIAENNTSNARIAIVTFSATGLEDKSITVTQPAKVAITPGGLHDLFSTSLATITSLSLGGKIDARDFKTMRDEMPLLAEIDLSGATIVAYNGTEGPSSYITSYAANTIPEFAFLNSNWNGKSSLTSFFLPTSTISIDQRAFQNCNGLTAISFPPSITSIGIYAFHSCQNISLINISASLTSIGANAFTACSGAITVDGGNPNYSSLDGVLYDKAKTLLIQCPTSKTGSFNIPSSVTIIGPSAFQNSQLNSIEIPSSVNSIKGGAFTGCTGLTSLVIPSSVKSIEAFAIQNCFGLSSVTAMSATPINLSSSPGVFYNLDKTKVILNVPAGSKAAYQAADQWKDFTNIVEMPNQTPIANAGSDQTVNAGSIVTLDGSSSNDPDGQSLTYTWTAPTGITLSSLSSIKPTFVAPEVQTDQIYNFSLIVNDGFVSSTVDQVAITVIKQVNKVPVANAGIDQSVNEGSTVSLDGSASSDPDGNPLTYKWTVPAGVTLSSTIVAKPTFTAPEVTTNTNYTFSLVVNDGTIDSPIDQVVITVKNVNKPPVANAGMDQSVNEGSIVSLDCSASTDPDGNPLTYKWTAPAGITLSSTTTLKPTFTAPEVTTNTNYTFSLVVNDGTIDSPVDQVVVTVKNVNKVPVANAGSGQTVNEGTTVSLDGSSSSDPDETSLTYKWTAPTGITLSSTTTAKPTFTAPEVTINTNYTFSLVVNDGTVDSPADQVVITVKNVNKVPVANAGVDQFVNEGTTVSLDGSSSSDPDGNALIYKWTAPAGITLSSTTVAKPTFTAPEVTTSTNYTFSLVVNDGTIDSPVDQVVVTVKNVNKVPVANAGSGQTVNEGTTVSLDGSSSSDPDGNLLTYKWTAPAGITLSSTTVGKPTFTAPEVTTNTNYTFSLVVNDGTIDSPIDQVVITVKNVNKPPVANAGVDQFVNEGTTVSLDGSDSSDPDGNALIYKWTAPAGITLSSTTVAKPTFTAPEVTTSTNYTFSLVVNDGTIDSPVDQVVVTVKNVNKVPVANAGSGQTVNEGTTVSLDGSSSSDPDGNLLTYKWTAPAGITLSSTIVGKPTFTAPEVNTNTNYTFSLVVEDGTVDSPVDQVVITVKNVNKVPVANAGIDQSVNEGSTISLDGSASSDPDGNPLTYKWTAPSGIALSSMTMAKPTFIAPEVKKDSTLSFSLVVNDGLISSLQSTVKVTVLNVVKVGVTTIGSPLLKVYPNPTAGIVNLEISGGMNREGEIVVTNLTGAEVFRKEINSDPKVQIDLSKQVNGIYVLNILIDNQQIISKIVIKRE